MSVVDESKKVHLWDFKECVVEYEGQNIRAYSFGTGRNVIFTLPSFPHSGLYYLWFMKHCHPSLATFITFDLPGWIGVSDNIFYKKKFDIKEYVLIAKKVADYFRVQSYGVVGYSFGGVLALLLTNLDPQRVKKLALVSTIVNGPKCHKHPIPRMVKVCKFFKLGWLLKFYVWFKFKKYKKIIELEGFPKKDLELYQFMITQSSGKIMLESLDMLFKKDYTDLLERVDGEKVLVVNSAVETPMFKHQSEYIRRKLNQEETYMIDGPHEDFLLRPSENTAHAIVEFLKS
jgi:pimeloyl-ACP methyl ester carboxylesterase